MKFVIQLYRFGNYLSLDVACGAMICAAFFSKIMHVQLRPYGLASLGLTVWIIYTADHLLDARKLKTQASSKRHRFHQDHFRVLSAALTLAILFDLVLLLFIRKQIIDWGIGLAGLVLLYLGFQRRLVIFKELVISFLYAAGVLLPALSLTQMIIDSNLIILIICFILTAYNNLILFSCYDIQDDISDRHFSLVTILGKGRAEIILCVSLFIQFMFLAHLTFFSNYTFEAFVLGLMNVVLFILFLFPARFKNGDLYRIIGDAVFLFPLPYLFMTTNGHEWI